MIARALHLWPAAALTCTALLALCLPACSSGGASIVYSACPSSGVTSASGKIVLEGDCTIAGDVNLSGTAGLTMMNGLLVIQGNLALSGNSRLMVTHGGLAFPQTNYNQYSVTLNDKSVLTLQQSVFITNGTQQNNFSMQLTAYDSSAVEVEDSSLNTDTGSWLLGDFRDNSKLTLTNAHSLPTEIYPIASASISISSGSSIAALWLNFPSGSSGTINIPELDPQGNFSFSFGPGTGIAYSVNVASSSGWLGLNSHPNSSLTVNGRGAQGANDVVVVFGYYVESNTGPVGINGLNVGGDTSEQFTDQGRNLQLNHVNLGPFAWQVYVSQSNGFPVSVTNSKINEIGAVNGGLINLSNSVLQLANTEAAGPGSVLNISNTQIWSQSIEAEDGGQLTISDSILNGNFISASGAGSSIAMTNVGDDNNGVPPQSCAPVDGYPPNNDGVPLCNPFNPLYQCSQIVPPAGGATITATPPLTCSEEHSR